MKKYLQNKVLVITGSARGIGRQAARLAVAVGARVVLNGRNAEALEATRLSLGAPDRVAAVAADVSTPEGARALVEGAKRAFGRIDAVIHNAGLSMRGPFAELAPTTVRTMVDANFLSAVWVTQAALPALRESRGRVLFVSSLAAVRGFAGVSLYSASKMALTALHQSLRAEEGPLVHFGLIYLAFTENDPDKTVLGADGRPFHHERRWSMTQDDAAGRLLDAVARRRKKTVLTAGGKGLFWGQSISPGLVDWFADRSGGKLHSVRRKP